MRELLSANSINLFIYFLSFVVGRCVRKARESGKIPPYPPPPTDPGDFAHVGIFQPSRAPFYARESLRGGRFGWCDFVLREGRYAGSARLSAGIDRDSKYR